MINRTIGIGETSSLRYIGVEPPLNDIIAESIERRIKLPAWIAIGTGFWQQTDPNNPPYTEFWFDVGDALDTLGKEIVDEGTVEIAQQIAELLKARGDSVTVLEHVIPTDFETPLFGEEADHLRELHKRFN